MTPTYEVASRFAREFDDLSREQKDAFLAAVQKFVEGLRSGTMPRGLRIKGVQHAPGVFELTFAPDGRATFSFGEARSPGERHVIWRRVGTHAVLKQP